MSNWNEDIKNGMFLITKGCAENTTWLNCHDCPLEELCEYIWDKNRDNGGDGQTVGEYFRDLWREATKS